jgi:hypothetical protein
LSTPWGTSPYATPTPVIDSVTRNPTPVPIPGLMPLGFPQAPVPYMGMPPLPFPQYAAPQVPVPYMGMPPLGFPQAPVPYMGMPPLGFPQYAAPQAPMPYMGMPPLGFPQVLGLDMQTPSWPITGLGGHVVSPVVTMLLSQLGLREAISRIGDEALKQRVTSSVNEAIDHTIESVSGMSLYSWLGSGAQFMIYPIAAQLALIAQRYPDGAVREGLLTIAGQIVQKSIAPTGEGTGRHK